jgi:hypothetical protein
MAIKEESAFLQEVESRLDSLFSEDTKPINEKDPGVLQTAVKEEAVDSETDDIREIPTLKETSRETEIALSELSTPDQPSPAKDAVAGIEEDILEIPTLKETIRQAEGSSEPIQTQDKSSFISEIEKRFSAIFGDNDKDVMALTEAEKPVDVEKIMAQAGEEEGKKSDELLGDISLPSSSVLHSPLKEMKSIVLSLEWEINDQILEQLEDEVNKLYLFYTGDRIIQGLLRILRFVGRYIRVRGVSSNQDSINLLMSVYGHLENVMVSEGVTEAKKYVFLMESIEQYRLWAGSTDLESPVEAQAPETGIDEVKPLELETSEDKFLQDQKGEATPFTDIRIAEEKPFVEDVIDQAAVGEPSLRASAGEDKIELAGKDRDILFQAPPAPADEVPPVRDEDVERMIAAMEDLPPHQAFAYALVELKKTFQAEIDALKEEIRILRNTG